MTDVTRQEFDALKKEVSSLKKSSKMGSKVPKVKRAPTEYNKFMSSNIGAIREKNPDMTSTEIFKEVAGMWSKQKAKK